VRPVRRLARYSPQSRNLVGFALIPPYLLAGVLLALPPRRGPIQTPIAHVVRSRGRKSMKGSSPLCQGTVMVGEPEIPRYHPQIADLDRPWCQDEDLVVALGRPVRSLEDAASKPLLGSRASAEFSAIPALLFCR